MADQRRPSTLLLTFITFLSTWPTTTESHDSWIINFLRQQCFDECPAKYFTSTYNVPCSDSCDKRGYSYYWCNTRKGWDYCSPSGKIDYKGNECQNTCGDYGDGRNECYLYTGSWSKCAQVEPQAFNHYTKYMKKCIDDCQYHKSGDYFWCHTEKGWDYCSPLPDYTYKGESCRYDHSCGAHGYSYSWCYTSYRDNWDYCGIINPGECTYTESYLRKGGTTNPRVICTRRDDDDDSNNRRVTNFLKKGGQTDIASVNKKLRNEALDLINKWDNQGLGGKSKSNLLRSANFRIDNQGLCNVKDQCCYNLQVQINKKRSPGESTTVAHIIVPVDTSAEYMRLAFKFSLENQVSVQIEVSKEPSSTLHNKQKCCRRRKN